MCVKPELFPRTPFSVIKEGIPFFKFLPEECQEIEVKQAEHMKTSMGRSSKLDNQYNNLCTDIVGHFEATGGDKLLEKMRPDQVQQFRRDEMRFAAENHIRMICWGQSFSADVCNTCISDGIAHLNKQPSTTIKGYSEVLSNFSESLGRYVNPK